MRGRSISKVMSATVDGSEISRPITVWMVRRKAVDYCEIMGFKLLNYQPQVVYLDVPGS